MTPLTWVPTLVWIVTQRDGDQTGDHGIFDRGHGPLVPISQTCIKRKYCMSSVSLAIWGYIRDLPRDGLGSPDRDGE